MCAAAAAAACELCTCWELLLLKACLLCAHHPAALVLSCVRARTSYVCVSLSLSSRPCCRLRVERAARLRALKAKPTLARDAIQVDETIAAAAAAARKKRRVVDVLQEVLGSSDGDDDDDDEEEEDGGGGEDWRKKGAA